MKKLLFISFLTIAISSCKKDWNCNCTTSLLGEEVTASEINDFNKKDAEEACKNVENAQSFENCRLEEK